MHNLFSFRHFGLLLLVNLLIPIAAFSQEEENSTKCPIMRDQIKDERPTFLLFHGPEQEAKKSLINKCLEQATSIYQKELAERESNRSFCESKGCAMQTVGANCHPGQCGGRTTRYIPEPNESLDGSTATSEIQISLDEIDCQEVCLPARSIQAKQTKNEAFGAINKKGRV